jgi:MFS family permease
MFARLSNTWELIKESAAVLRADKELIIYPIVSSIGVLIVSALFLVPVILGGITDRILTGGSNQTTIVGFAILFAFYFAQYFVIIFANSALIGAAMIRLRGGDPTLGDGFRIAFSHVGVILGYALIASTVGMILRTLANRRQSTLGRLAISLVGMAWNLATFLAVPVLVVEDVGPFEAIRRSTQLLKKTWGEQIVGNFGIGGVFGLISIAYALILGVPLGYLAFTLESPALFVVLVVLLVVGFVIVGLLSSTLSGIFAASVYRYAAEGASDAYIRPELVQNAFRSSGL